MHHIDLEFSEEEFNQRLLAARAWLWPVRLGGSAGNNQPERYACTTWIDHSHHPWATFVSLSPAK